MTPILIVVAFALGFAARQIGLPPLVGFLLAGFVLQAFGAEGGPALERIADLGVILLLFSIGLKLRLKSLLRPEVWAGASVHMLVTTLVLAGAIQAVGAAGLSRFGGLEGTTALLIAFALSFSSTVFAVKVLEERGELESLHGRVSIGVLIMQDLIAVLFLAASTGELPSPWALLLIGLVPLRRPLGALMDRCGHGELLILFGFLLALLGAELFELAGLKGELGALVLGVLVAGHPKAAELAQVLFGFKELFLVGFFLAIGLTGAPDAQAVGIAVLLALVVPFKVALFFVLFSRFRLRARTSLLASLSLANYSEFGLIVAAIGVRNGWLASEWLIVIAIALSITFVLASPLNQAAHALHARLRPRLAPFETEERHPDDRPIDSGDAEILVFGMGRIGTGAYDAMRRRFGEAVLGLDHDGVVVQEHRQAGRNVVLGDATDSDFWERLQPGKVRLVMLAMPQHSSNEYAARRLAESDYRGLVAATARFADERERLEQEGVDAAFDLYAEAGGGFADDVCEKLGDRLVGSSR